MPFFKKRILFLQQKTGQDHVDIITFYNEIFVPTVKPLLVEFSPAGTTQKDNQVAEASNNNDGKLSFQVFLPLGCSFSMNIFWTVYFSTANFTWGNYYFWPGMICVPL